jgi:hypothetical protein
MRRHLSKLKPARICLALIWMILVVSGVPAEEMGVAPPPKTNSPQPPLAAWNGSYADQITIDVPAFRGLTPNINLTYDSSRGVRNIPGVGGILGIGWSVGGLLTIDRISGAFAPPAGQDAKTGGHGVPGYGSIGLPPDGYALNGSELIPCAVVQNPSSTPSCAVPTVAGQVTYAGRVEAFTRIRQVASTNSWEVTAKDGTKSLFSSFEGSDPGQTFRWHLTSVLDRRGNHVDYAWSCNATFECTIATIKYFNQGSNTPVAEIGFITEPRPDTITYATGKDIRATSRRVKAIKVSAAGQLLRAYAMTYQASASTGLSLLASVQQFGRDATVDAAGNVSGRTSLPPTVMVYSSLASGASGPAFATSDWVEYQYDEGSSAVPSNPFPTQTGDFNGDNIRNDFHRPKLYFVSGTGGGPANPPSCEKGLLINGTGASNPITYGNGGYGCIHQDMIPETSGGGDSATEQLARIRENAPPVADYNGDGKDDPGVTSFSFITDCNSGGNCHSTITAGTTYILFDGTTVTSPIIGGSIAYAADFNGDGKVDILKRSDVATTSGTLYVSSGTGFTALTTAVPAMPARFDIRPFVIDYNRRVDVADLNGDGKSDLLEHWFANGNWNSVIWLSNGSSFQPQAVQALPWAGLDFNTSGFYIADANGDGLSDVIAVKRSSNTAYEARSLVSKGRAFDLSLPPVAITGFTDIPVDGFFGKRLLSTTDGFSFPIAGTGNFDGDALADLYLTDGATHKLSRILQSNQFMVRLFLSRRRICPLRVRAILQFWI